MAFPEEFKGKFQDEDHFVQQFLIPMLNRLGYSTVVNYHGKSEYGKDLIFAEIDRFGHARYHGLQAKHEESISLNGTEDLINDCKQALNNPFTHPQTGMVERISSFYVANAGSLGPEAVSNFFNSLRPLYGANVHLLQGKDLITLDRWASVRRNESVASALTGLILEIRYNNLHGSWLRSALAKADKAGPPVNRLKHDTVSAYLAQPLLAATISMETMVDYWHRIMLVNRILDRLHLTVIAVPQEIMVPSVKQVIGLLDLLDQDARALTDQVKDTLSKLGAIAGI